MLDWKIAAAAVVALLVVSTVLLGGFGIGEFFSDIINKIGEWLGSSPFGGFFATPTTPTKEINIVLYPANLSLKPESDINVSVNTVTLRDFRGEIDINFNADIITFKELGSALTIEVPLEKVTIPNLRIKNMKFENMKFDIKPSITSENGSMEIHGFLGNTTVNEDNIEFLGNISKMIVTIGNMSWEIK